MRPEQGGPANFRQAAARQPSGQEIDLWNAARNCFDKFVTTIVKWRGGPTAKIEFDFSA
ncbi:MAG: hypothetical protein ACYDCE_03735 [Candidatus Acidiferrales bacterium]